VRLTVVVVVTLALALCTGAGRAHAARFQVQPTRLDLGGAHAVGSLVITNRSDQPVRFQVTAAAWSEGEDGATAMAPTEDVILYPSLFTLAAGESRAVRVTTTARPGEREVPYRVFVSELPPMRAPGAPTATRINMLTRMAIPVFLPPAADRVAGELTASLADGGVDIRIRNRGSVHVRVKSVRVIGLAGGAVVFDRSQAGWYLLAAGVRRYRLPLAAEQRAIDHVRIDVVSDRATWSTTVAVEPAARAR
jgi:fimbrial chaperone protein